MNLYSFGSPFFIFFMLATACLIIEGIVVNRQHKRELKQRIEVLMESVTEALRLANQVRFLLNQAPMQRAPDTAYAASFAVTKYAYIHPDTRVLSDGGLLVGNRHNFGGRTIWIVTDLMPKGAVIYTPNLMPRMELPGKQNVD